MPPPNSPRAGPPSAPRDAVAVAAMLKGMGIEKYEPAVVHMLLDVMHGHVTGLLHTARGLADHACKPEVDMEDLRLAASTQRTPPDLPARSAVLAVARERNAVPLPQIAADEPSAPGQLPLPPRSEWLRPQRGIEIELPPKIIAKADEPEGPWVISNEERKQIENDLQRRRAAIAAPDAPAAASPAPASRATAAPNAVKPVALANSSKVGVGEASASVTEAAAGGIAGAREGQAVAGGGGQNPRR